MSADRSAGRMAAEAEADLGKKRVAGELGLEPRMTVPKTAVLPLHHSPAGTAKPLRARRGGGDSAGVGRMQRRFELLFFRHFSFCGGIFVACETVEACL